MKWIMAAAGIALIAAVLFFSATLFTTSIYEAEPERQLPVAKLPPPKTSIVFVPLSVPLAALEQAINAGVPPRFSGNKPDFTDLLRDDRITWRVNRGHINVSGDGRLHLRVTANGEAKARGVLDLLLAKTTVSATAHIESSLHLSGQPRILEDWRVQPHLAGDVVVHRAEIPVKHVGSVSVRGEVKRALDREKNGLIAKLEGRITEDSSLRREVEKAWKKLFVTKQVLQRPAVWLRVKPIVARLSQPQVTRDAIHLGIGFDFISELVYAEDAPENPITLLPNALIGQPGKGSLDATVVAALPWKELSALMSDTMSRKPMPIGSDGEVRFTNVALSPAGKSVLFEVDLAARNSWLERAEGRVRLVARPVLSDDGSRLALKDMQYAVAGGAAVQAIAWLYESNILEQLEKVSEVDISPWVTEARVDAQDKADQLLDRLPPGISAAIDVKSVSVDDLLPTRDYLMLTFGIQASLESSVTTIDIAQ